MKYKEDERGYQCRDEDKLGLVLFQGYLLVNGVIDESNQIQYL